MHVLRHLRLFARIALALLSAFVMHSLLVLGRAEAFFSRFQRTKRRVLVGPGGRRMPSATASSVRQLGYSQVKRYSLVLLVLLSTGVTFVYVLLLCQVARRSQSGENMPGLRVMYDYTVRALLCGHVYTHTHTRRH